MHHDRPGTNKAPALNYSPDWPRELYFELLHAAIAEYYPADLSNPYRQWAEQRSSTLGRHASIVCHYRNENQPVVDVASVVESAGYKVSGWTEAPGVTVVWIESPQ